MVRAAPLVRMAAPLMHTFFMLITLASLTGAQITYFGPDQQWSSQAACDAALPKMERIVQQVISLDPDALALIGVVVGKPSRAYFVKMSDCIVADEIP